MTEVERQIDDLRETWRRLLGDVESLRTLLNDIRTEVLSSLPPHARRDLRARVDAALEGWEPEVGRSPTAQPAPEENP